MNDSNIRDMPTIHSEIARKSKEIGFAMPSDVYIGTLLKTLISSKPAGKFLELGTGIGLSLSWMRDGMDENSSLISVDNDPELIAIAEQYFGKDERIEILCEDGSEWIKKYKGRAFDLVFADAWPGKYSELDEILGLIKVGGFYIIDDMTAQPNWPEGHEEHVDGLISYLEHRSDFNLTKMNWSTGVIVAVKTK
ncbi:methyltransferase domain-containing protein [Aggregatimonas sangjinii]|uniref:Methyltransferase domain-containing protein n=1 Tax=Aggregatimonas sangjinii TaxID=2583587 RepID=A0A5B7SMH5_9FLAO|nr:class I SAM-dependent methyltransferase [Aggregatimonas sangjinii]QCW99844.1 methyltransferase domain-containing protein [Aggregatimonas sangjinii]